MRDDDEAPEEAEDEAAEAAETDGEGEGPSPDAEARKQGWVPRKEFRGDPEDWTSADEYLRLGDPKYLRKALRDQKKEVRKLAQAREQDAKGFNERLERFEAMSKAQRSRMYGEIEAAREAAVEAGDTAEYRRLNKVEADLYEQEQAAGKTSAKPKDAEQAQPDDELIHAWIDDNPWWDTDPQMQHAAMTINQRIAKRYPDLSTQEQLDRTKEEVVKRFPEKFGKQAAKPQAKTNGHSAVEGGQRAPASPKGKGFTDIPAEERKIIERHVEEGLYKDKADAAKAYWR